MPWSVLYHTDRLLVMDKCLAGKSEYDIKTRLYEERLVGIELIPTTNQSTPYFRNMTFSSSRNNG